MVPLYRMTALCQGRGRRRRRWERGTRVVMASCRPWLCQNKTLVSPTHRMERKGIMILPSQVPANRKEANRKEAKWETINLGSFERWWSLVVWNTPRNGSDRKGKPHMHLASRCFWTPLQQTSIQKQAVWPDRRFARQVKNTSYI